LATNNLATNGGSIDDYDPIKGMEVKSAYQISLENENSTVGAFTANVNIAKQTYRGTRYVFTAKRSGVYWIYSLNEDTTLTPSMYILDDEETAIAEYDNSRDYFALSEGIWYNNFSAYIYLEEGESVNLSLCVDIGATGTYPFKIEYVGTTASKLLVCTTAGGLWEGTSDSDAVYIAIDVVYNSVDDCYYSIDDNFEQDSKIYIDFIHPSYYTTSQNFKLIDLIDNGMFDFSSKGGKNYTALIRSYYYKSLQRDTKDELYGMIEANKELVDILNAFMVSVYGSAARDQKVWLAFACYYETYGPQA
jgi:hypothetical protein